jgi:hypothetical protein
MVATVARDLESETARKEARVRAPGEARGAARVNLITTLTVVTEDPPPPFPRAGPPRPVAEDLLAREPHRRPNRGQAHTTLRATQRERPTPADRHRQSDLELR